MLTDYTRKGHIFDGLISLRVLLLIKSLDQLSSECVKHLPKQNKVKKLFGKYKPRNEPRHVKTNVLHMRKQIRRSVQSLYFINPKFQASSHFL